MHFLGSSVFREGARWTIEELIDSKFATKLARANWSCSFARGTFVPTCSNALQKPPMAAKRQSTLSRKRPRNGHSLLPRGGAGLGFELVELLAVAQGDERVARCEDRVAGRVVDHAALGLLDGHDNHPKVLPQLAVLQRLAGKPALGVDDRLLDLQVEM